MVKTPAAVAAGMCLTLGASQAYAASPPRLPSHPDRAAATSGCATHSFTRAGARDLLSTSRIRLRQTDRALDPMAYPSVTDTAGTWTTTSRAAWTSGFYPGSLWLAYRATHRPNLKRSAVAWTRPLEAQDRDTSTHDVGFQIMSSFGNGYAVTHEPRDKKVILRAAESLVTRYDPDVGAIRSWGRRHNTRHFKVIIDNLMNLELLFWAGAHGGPHRLRHVAARHAMTTARHFIRRDGSVIHLIDFDPRTGKVIGTANPQGYSADSTWSRGQAWALHGFATAYRYTGRAELLGAARRTAGYFTRNLPAACVPYWDFDAPDIPNAPTDTAAAAIAADGLLELARLEPDHGRRKTDRHTAATILWSLHRRFVAPSGHATLDGATATFGVEPSDIGTSYGDYYALRADTAWLRDTKRRTG